MFQTLIKRFQSNWNYIINMGKHKTKVDESLLAQTCRKFWCALSEDPWEISNLNLFVFQSPVPTSEFCLLLHASWREEVRGRHFY